MKKIFLIFPIILLLVACVAPITGDNDLKIKCDNNDGKACVEYGSIIYDNYTEALKYNTKSCELNNEWGCYKTAMIYKLGLGLPKNIKKAELYLRKACDLNNSMESAFSCNDLAALLSDSKERIKYFTKACDLGDGMACENILKDYIPEYKRKPSKILADKIELFVAKACENHKNFVEKHPTCEISNEIKKMGGFANFHKKYGM